MLIAALVSGGIAGLAGVSEIAGIHYHLISELSGGYGYTGIIVATLGGLNPFGATAAALFIGLIDTGAQTVSRVLGVPVYLGDVVQSTLLLVTLACAITELPYQEDMIMGDFIVDIIAATLRIATPLIFATLGELFASARVS